MAGAHSQIATSSSAKRASAFATPSAITASRQRFSSISNRSWQLLDREALPLALIAISLRAPNKVRRVVNRTGEQAQHLHCPKLRHLPNRKSCPSLDATDIDNWGS